VRGWRADKTSDDLQADVIWFSRAAVAIMYCRAHERRQRARLFAL
jgi:hypothetical protein